RMQVGEAQRLLHPVLRLEQAQRCAEALRSLEALHELAQAVAVDVIHVRKIEEDLARPLVQELLDQAREHLFADADGETALEVDDDDVALLASLDVHAGGIILDELAVGGWPLTEGLCQLPTANCEPHSSLRERLRHAHARSLIRPPRAPRAR